MGAAAVPCTGGCCFMAISLCTRCGQGHLDDALDWDEGWMPHTPAHLVAAPEFPLDHNLRGS